MVQDITGDDVSTGQGTAQDLDAGCLDRCLDPTPPPDPIVLQEAQLGLGLHSAKCFPPSGPQDSAVESQRGPTLQVRTVRLRDAELPAQGHTGGRRRGRHLNRSRPDRGACVSRFRTGLAHAHTFPSLKDAPPCLTLPPPPTSYSPFQFHLRRHFRSGPGAGPRAHRVFTEAPARAREDITRACGFIHGANPSPAQL